MRAGRRSTRRTPARAGAWRRSGSPRPARLRRGRPAPEPCFPHHGIYSRGRPSQALFFPFKRLHASSWRKSGQAHKTGQGHCNVTPVDDHTYGTSMSGRPVAASGRMMRPMTLPWAAVALGTLLGLSPRLASSDQESPVTLGAGLSAPEAREILATLESYVRAIETKDIALFKR